MTNRFTLYACSVGITLVTLSLAACSGESSTSEPTPSPTSSPELEAAAPDSPSPESLPELPAPQGLGGLRLPDNPERIVAVFERMPAAIDGWQRDAQANQAGSEAVQLRYQSDNVSDCVPIGLQSMDVSRENFFPGGTTADGFIAFWTTGADWEVESFGRDDSLFWVLWNTTCESDQSMGAQNVAAASWGMAGSNWVFTAMADSERTRGGLLAEFVSAAR